MNGLNKYCFTQLHCAIHCFRKLIASRCFSTKSFLGPNKSFDALKKENKKESVNSIYFPCQGKARNRKLWRP